MENTVVKVLATEARTTTTNSVEQVNYNSRGAHIVIDVTVAPASGSITPKIQGIVGGGSIYYDILVGSPITTAGVNLLKVYPGIASLSGISANDSLPIAWRVVIEHSTSNSFTYSVFANLVA